MMNILLLLSHVSESLISGVHEPEKGNFATYGCAPPGRPGRAAVTVTKSITITVRDTDGAARAGVKVYAFDGLTYTNFNSTTDADGQAQFMLPQGAYRFRADTDSLKWNGAHPDDPVT